MAQLEGVSKQAVSQSVRGRRLLALQTGSGRLVHPLWQFHEGAPLPGLAEVLDAVGYDPARPSTGWTVASWFSTDDPDLGGTPRSLLAAGRLEAHGVLVVPIPADVPTVSPGRTR